MKRLVIDTSMSQDCKGSNLERAFATQLVQSGLPTFHREFVFHPKRLWRFDFCWPEMEFMLAIEIEGGTWNGGRHVTGKGFRDDCEKLSEAAIFGYHVIRLTSDMVDTGVGVEMVDRYFRNRCPTLRRINLG